jgi:hypothetical protein
MMYVCTYVCMYIHAPYISVTHGARHEPGYQPLCALVASSISGKAKIRISSGSAPLAGASKIRGGKAGQVQLPVISLGTLVR